MAKSQAATYLWIVWFEIAVAQELEAKKARLSGKAEALGAAYLTAQDDELRAAMIGVSAAAHALDAFYGTIAHDVVLPDGFEEAWRQNQTRRPSRIIETLKAGFDVSKRIVGWNEELTWLSDLRDAAVHHQSELRPTGDHPSGRALVPQENIDYSCEATTRAVDLALDVMATCLRSPRSDQLELAEWAKDEVGRAGQLEQVRGHRR